MVMLDSVGASGGLAVFWKKEIDLAVQSMSKYHISMIIEEEDGFSCRYTRIYGESKAEEKTNTWDTLRCLRVANDLLWLCSGDFNEILFHHEKEGVPMKPETIFCKALKDCDLHDLSYVGDVYTSRNNHHATVSYVHERLDRIVANTAWRCKFPIVRVINGDPRHYDHRHIIVVVRVRELRRWEGPREVLRKFGARWLEETDCEAMVEEAGVMLCL